MAKSKVTKGAKLSVEKKNPEAFISSAKEVFLKGWCHQKRKWKKLFC